MSERIRRDRALTPHVSTVSIAVAVPPRCRRRRTCAFWAIPHRPGAPARDGTRGLRAVSEPGRLRTYSAGGHVCGRPVLGYGAGGALHTVVPGVTGGRFPEQTVALLTEVLMAFDPAAYGLRPTARTRCAVTPASGITNPSAGASKRRSATCSPAKPTKPRPFRPAVDTSEGPLRQPDRSDERGRALVADSY